MNILLISATDAEIAPLLQSMAHARTGDSNNVYRHNNVHLKVAVTGVGMMATTYHLTKLLAETKYDLVIQAGVGGAFNRDIPLGEVVVVEQDEPGDLGAEDHDNIIDIFSLGLADKDAFPFVNGGLPTPDSKYMKLTGLTRVKSITVNMVSGNTDTIAYLSEKFGCDTESMEGLAMHYVCLNEGVDFVQFRAISNYVEPRDKSKWQMGKAITNLNNYLSGYIADIVKMNI